MQSEALHERIKQKYGTQAAMARQMHWTRQRLNKIVQGRKEPDVTEVATMAKALDMSITDTAQFFLPHESPNGQQRR